MTKKEYVDLHTQLQKKRGEKVVGTREGLDGGSMFVVDEKVVKILRPKMVKKALELGQPNPEFGILLLLEMF